MKHVESQQSNNAGREILETLKKMQSEKEKEILAWKEAELNSESEEQSLSVICVSFAPEGSRAAQAFLTRSFVCL